MKAVYALSLFVVLTFAGCASIPEEERIGTGFKPFWIASNPRENISLKNDYTVTVIGGSGILGDSKLTLLKGEYEEHGEDAEGVYYRHKNQGVIRSGNAGIAEKGGFYIPFDGKVRWRVWLVPHIDRDAMIGLYGPAGGLISEPDAKRTVLVLSNVLVSEMQGLKDDVISLKKAPRPPEPVASIGASAVK
ncbi:MAG TPA: hypothetical protein VK717_07105 [Opitutaceae bacterium]|nr:hypothetical protein [Opitutaceae bacterium]